MQVGQALLDTAADAKKAFDSVYYLSESRKQTEKIVKTVRELNEETAVQRDYGFTSDQDVFLGQILFFEAQLELNRIAQELSVARARLNRIMGLRAAQTDYSISGGDSREIGALPAAELAVKHALDHRLDVRVARFKLDQARRSLDLEKKRFLRHVDLGLAYERETDGTDLLGPAVTVQVPLFDQNQARISKARYRTRQAEKDLEALEGKVHEEIVSNLERIELCRTRTTHYREKIIPLREAIVEYVTRWVDAMQLNRLSLLEAQRGLLESQREYSEALLALHHALTDLERDMGGVL